jgi:hypothetical protein
LMLRSSVLAVAIALAGPAQPAHPAHPDPLAVRYSEGLTHGFLILTTLNGNRIADGDLIQIAQGMRVKSRLVFRFKDGSFYEDTTVFTQRQRFRLISDHVVQKGPSFPQALDVVLDAMAGQLTVRSADGDGEEKVESQHMDLPADTANGMLLSILKNLQPDKLPATVSFVAATPKTRLVKLAITAAADDSFTTAGTARKATHFILKVQIGGLTGLVASLIGKQPPDSHVWIYHDEAPGFVKAELPLFTGGPLWRIQLVTPTWPHGSS